MTVHATLAHMLAERLSAVLAIGGGTKNDVKRYRLLPAGDLHG